MTERHVEVTTRGLGSRILGSIKGMLIGVLLFFLAFVVLWMNEGRVDISKIADDSIPVSAASVDPANDGTFVAASGTLTSDERLGDEFLTAGPYIQLRRNVEMYAWVEQTEQETETNTGGSETTTTEYYYETTWTSNPRRSSSFKVPDGHENPPLHVEDASTTVSSARVGALAIDPNAIGLPSAQELALSQNDVAEGVDASVQSNYLLLGTASLQDPQVGDVRIRYRAVPSDVDVTAFGKQQGDRLVPYVHRGETRVYRVYTGDRSSAIASMASAHKTTGWLLRAAGFLMMWFGLTLILGPISTVLDVLPILGRLSRTMLAFVAFGIALVLSLITIVVSVIVHNTIILVTLLLLFGGAVVLLARRTRTEPTAA